MAEATPSLSTDQVVAFVELARQGSFREAAGALGITEQGMRGRLLALEGRLGVQLYRKSRGASRASRITAEGRRFLPHALAFLERARELSDLFEEGDTGEIHVAASQYLVVYVLIDALRRFQQDSPGIHVRLSTLNEREVEEAVLHDPDVAFGVAAPYEPSPDLEYTDLFALDWSLIAPRGHPLLSRRRLGLRDLVDQPLILFERGSTGRQHVIDAFHDRGLSPNVRMETTNTEIVVRMVEAGLGVSIVPLLSSGVVTRGRRVGVRSLRGRIRAIHSGVLLRRGEHLRGASARFLDFVKGYTPS